MPKISKPLNNTQIVNAKPKDRPYKLNDGAGLYLYVAVSGSRTWRIDYTRPTTKKRATLTIGSFPAVSLADARKKRGDIKYLLASGIDPRQKQIDDERERKLQINNTFASIANEYIERKKQTSTDSTIKNDKLYSKYLCNTIGKMPISEIKPIDVLDACRVYEKKNRREAARKMKSFASQVFRYGVQTARCERDVTQDLKGALIPPEKKHHSAIIDPKKFAILLNLIDEYHGRIETKIALQLISLFFVRNIEMRFAKWSDFDFDEKIWSFTPSKTRNKTGVELIVPLSKQAIILLSELALHRRSEYLFPALHTTLKPISENTLNFALKRIGYSSEEHTIHGFRASARTMLVEQLKYDEKLVEMQLGHRVRDMHGRAYNRVQWLEERRKMMQTWADYLDELKAKK